MLVFLIVCDVVCVLLIVCVVVFVCDDVFVVFFFFVCGVDCCCVCCGVVFCGVNVLYMLMCDGGVVCCLWLL